jgi:hypothetical protein
MARRARRPVHGFLRGRRDEHDQVRRVLSEPKAFAHAPRARADHWEAAGAEVHDRAVQNGIDKEPMALGRYEAETGEIVTRVGFLSHNELMAGCSLDAAIMERTGSSASWKARHRRARRILST